GPQRRARSLSCQRMCWLASAKYRRTVGGRGVRSAVSSPAPTAPSSSSVRLTSEPAAADPLLEPGRADARVGGLGLTLDERDRLVERRPARTDVRHRFVLVPDRHAAEEEELRRG